MSCKEEMVSDPNSEDDSFTEQEMEIIRTAMTILPHIGPEATTNYIEKATQAAHRGEHE